MNILSSFNIKQVHLLKGRDQRTLYRAKWWIYLSV